MYERLQGDYISGGYFRYYRQEGGRPFPRTFATALRGFHNGQLSLEPALYRAGSADSIFQQPLNVHLVLDLMANAERDHTVNQALGAVLFDNLGDPDREIADFAAQALARLEERYYQWIQDAEEHAAEEAELYIAFAELQRFNPMLRSYYLRKVLAMDPAVVEPVQRVRALVALGELDEAEQEILRDGIENTSEGLWMLADISFSRGDLKQVAELLRKALKIQRERGEKPTPSQEQALALWGVS